MPVKFVRGRPFIGAPAKEVAISEANKHSRAPVLGGQWGIPHSAIRNPEAPCPLPPCIPYLPSPTGMGDRGSPNINFPEKLIILLGLLMTGMASIIENGRGWGLVAPAAFKAVGGRRSRLWEVQFLPLPVIITAFFFELI